MRHAGRPTNFALINRIKELAQVKSCRKEISKALYCEGITISHQWVNEIIRKYEIPVRRYDHKPALLGLEDAKQQLRTEIALARAEAAYTPPYKPGPLEWH